MATAKTASPSGAKASRPVAKRSATKRPAEARETPARARAPRSTAELVGDYAERAVLIPVGAALIARERVNDAIANYSSPTKTQAQLRKFERRGNTARKRVEREVRKTRVRFERELRQRRRSGEQLADRLQERIQSLV
jgi:hypothetical protein